MSQPRAYIEISRSVITYVLAIFFVGVVFGVGLAASIYHQKTMASEDRNLVLLSTNNNLQKLMARMSLAQEASLEMMASPAISSNANIRSNNTSLSPIPRQATPVASNPARREPILPPPNMAVTSTVVTNQTSAAVANVAPNVVSTAAPTAPNSESKNSISMDKAGIAAIDSGGVHFKSGRHVLVGEVFPSGETLLTVIPAEGRIVTSKRTIILAKPQN